jgi:hypothetical protein
MNGYQGNMNPMQYSTMSDSYFQPMMSIPNMQNVAYSPEPMGMSYPVINLPAPQCNANPSPNHKLEPLKLNKEEAKLGRSRYTTWMKKLYLNIPIKIRKFSLK